MWDRNALRLAVSIAALVFTSYPSHAVPKADTHQGDSQAAVADALNNIASTYREQAKRAQADKNTEPCERGDDRRYSDLCAQWKAADAANEAAAWGKWGLIAGVFSLFGVLCALGISIWSNLIVRSTAKHELRAYLGVKSVDALPDGNGHLTARVVIYNFGSTPAQNVSAKIKGVIGKFPSQVLDENSLPMIPQICPISLHPGAEFDLFAADEIKSIEAIFDGVEGLYVYGCVEYVDFDGGKHETNFCYRGTQSTLMNKGQMRVSFEGNNAT